MRPRATPGQQLSAGRLRVDAAKAIFKLREYQLADRTAWVLEAIRAAVAASATRVLLRGDANDVWLCWDGEPWDVAELPRLFDELVSPEATGDRQHARLLAAAVNSALGLAPAYVDVFSVEGKGRAHRARYTPEVLVPRPADELGDSPLAQLTTVAAAPPPGANRGMAIHLRRRLGIEVLSYFFRDEPPELALARASCRDLPVPLWIGEEELGRHLASRDVVRLPLGADLDGFLAVVDPSSASGSRALELAERGVTLVAAPLPFELASSLDRTSHPRELPLRAFLDAPRMPTNASRSSVRFDVHPIPAARKRATELWPALLAELVAALRAALAEDPKLAARARDSAASPSTVASFVRARAAALALIGAVGPRWEWTLPPELRGLGELPLVCDATGAPQPITRLWRPFAHTGRSPMDAELGPWLADVLWLPPDDAAASLVPPSQSDARAFRHHLRWARREHRARVRFFAHAPRQPRVIGGGPFRVRARVGAKVAASCVPDAWFAGIEGEVAIGFAPEAAPLDAHRDDAAWPDSVSELSLLLEGRDLERLDFQSPIPFAAALEPAGLSPVDAYRAALRDHVFACASEAMRGAVVRAMEALALAEVGRPVPEGFALGPSEDPEAHARSLRAALTLVVELGLPAEGPLTEAAAWRASDGSWVSLAELLACPAFGTIPPGALIALPEGRLVVEADAREHAALGKLARGRPVIRYSPTRSRASYTAAQLAEKLLLTGSSFALAIDGERTAAAIAPARESQLFLHHHGQLLERRVHAARLTRCHIFVDAAAAVPANDWRGLREVGISAAELVAWERALAQAAARALIGQRPAELHGQDLITVDGELGLALADALRELDPEELLGADLYAALRAAPLFRVLGSQQRRSAGELAGLHERAVPYVTPSESRAATPDPGFEVLLADESIARMAARLAGSLGVFNATSDLDYRREKARRARQLADHRARPVAPFTLPEGLIGLELPSLVTRCLAGVTIAPPQERGIILVVYVESRPFGIVRFPDRMPLVALVDLKEAETNRAFTGVNELLLEQIIAELDRLAPHLTLELSRRHPEAFDEPGGARALLAACLAAQRFDAATRAELSATLTFPTLGGQRLSLTSAPHHALVAAWDDAWLGEPSLAGEPTAAADPAPPPSTGKIFRVPPGDAELHKILTALHAGTFEDVTPRVVKVQALRRMALGLVRRPSVLGGTAALKRKLEDLDAKGHDLGPGELALVADSTSMLLLHEAGELRAQVRIPDVQPAVHLAIEAPDLVARYLARAPARWFDPVAELAAEDRPLAEQAQALALELVRQVLAATAPAQLPPWLLRGLRRLVLSKQLTEELANLSLFETSDGVHFSWRALHDQIALFGNVWAVTAPTGQTCLDPRRVVFVLALEEQQLARRAGWPVQDASLELELDTQARVSLARPRAARLAIDPSLTVLASTTLDGDGETGPRGVVALLAAQHASSRGITPHHQMLPLARISDGCAWPTIAMVDDARLLADRTWHYAVTSPALVELRSAVERASEQLLAGLVRPPDSALAAKQITEPRLFGMIALRHSKAQLRGALWLEGPPGPSAVSIIEGATHRTYSPPHTPGLRGTLLVYLPDDDPLYASVDAALAELCELVHRALLSELVVRDDVEPELVAAHVASGLLRGYCPPQVPSTLLFHCFRPKPIGTSSLLELIRSGERVPLVPPAAPVSELSICDDGSATARVLLPRLGSTTRRPSWRARVLEPLFEGVAEAAAQSPPPASTVSPANAPSSETREALDALSRVLLDPPRESHPLDPLVALLTQRIALTGVLTPRFELLRGVDSPLASADGATIRLAADHPRLLAIGAAGLAATAWHLAAVDALAAHLVTLLNLALTSVTDATEHHALATLLQDA